MKCEQIQKMLPAFMEGILSKTENALVEKHLAFCTGCRTGFEEYQQARQLIGQLEEVEPPPGFAQKIMARVEEAEGKKAGFFQKLFYPLHIKVPLQAVAMVAVAVLAIQVYRSVEPQKQAIPQPGIMAVPESKEESGKKEDRREETAQPAKKTLPAREQETRTAGGFAKDTPASPPPASLPAEETRLSKDKTAAPSQVPITPAPPREAEKAEWAAGGKRAKMEMKSQATAPSREAASRPPLAQIGLTLQAENPAAVGEKVQAILQEVGGTRIEISRLGEGEVITAELNPERLPLLLNLLRPLGEMPEKPLVFESAAFASIRIEITRK